ncbi:MAG: hypothetical protein H6Q02_159 [Acidobacteria bacterium]|nr:hypothetical protein [Acidobacteriota bacterium]
MSRHVRVAAAVLATLVAACGRAPRPDGGTAPAATPEPAVISAVTLFFPGEDGLLERETREVADLAAPGPARVRAIVAELIAGSQQGRPAALPWAATLHAAFVDRAGNAFVDLSAPPEGAIEGTADEAAVVYAVVESVVANCPGVERVQLLFDGSEVATLGHLDLSRPLAPRPELVAP